MGILEFTRNWWDKCCKQGFPYRLSYLDKPEDDNFKHICRPPLQCHTRCWGPVYRLEGIIHLGEEDWGSVLVNPANGRNFRSSETCFKTGENWKGHLVASPPGSGCSKASLRSWRYGACEIKFWRRSRQKRAAKPPSRSLIGFAAKTYFACAYNTASYAGYSKAG